MTWTRLPDDFTDLPAVMRLSRSARLLHVEALVWCNRMLTNGEIPAKALGRISDSENIGDDVLELLDAGLWWASSDSDNWQVDWSSQETAEAVEQRRGDRNARQRKFNDRRHRHAKGDHTVCDPRFCPTLRGAPDDASHNASRNDATNPSDDGLPTRPVPTRPDPKGGTGSGTGRGGSPSGTSAPAPLRAGPSGTPPEVGEMRPPGAADTDSAAVADDDENDEADAIAETLGQPNKSPTDESTYVWSPLPPPNTKITRNGIEV